MGKDKTIFVCSSCGYESAKWLGKCPACNEWNSFYEEKIIKENKNSAEKGKKNATPKMLKEVEGKEKVRTSTGIGELDRVLGGGLVRGSLVLLGGEPGIGKSTLILQLCNKMSGEGKVLYVSGEESAEQIKIRADRLNINNEDIMFLGETDIDLIQENILQMCPKLVIIDSIQTMYSEDISSAAGTVSQVREITSRIMRVCKSNDITTIIIGHVTKEGNIAGPRVLEHMVDTVLYLEGERYFSYRILRSVKNRFGSTNEIGVFEMRQDGLVEVANPSEYMLNGRPEGASGSVVVCLVEGTRPLMVEVQALVCDSNFGMPRRTAAGTDYNRVNLLMAVLEKRAGMRMSSSDAYVNVAGGIKVTEPALDLGIVIALVSSFRNKEIDSKTVIFGEVGLSGEVRAVTQVQQRVNEAVKLGFTTCILPSVCLKNIKNNDKINLIGIHNVNEAINLI